MTSQNTLTDAETALLHECTEKLNQLLGNDLHDDERARISELWSKAIQTDTIVRDAFGLHPLVSDVETAEVLVTEIGVSRAAVLGLLLNRFVASGLISLDEISRQFGSDVSTIVTGLTRINELYEKNPIIESENFKQLLLSLATDMRVILIVIASRVCVMRNIKDTDNDKARRKVSTEAAYLYAPLAHKLGLYKLKSELEDLSLKYLEHDAYYHIKDKLNATKKSRDAYIERFIKPIDERLKAAGLNFHMKGRTKSIHSI